MQAYKLSTVDKVKQCMELPPVADENPIKLADQMIALTREATAEDIVKTMFLLKLPDSVRKVMWAEPLKDWPDMKSRAKGLWHAEKTKRQAAMYEVSGAQNIGRDEEPEAHSVRVKPKGKSNQNTKKVKEFKEFPGTFYQRPNGPCVYHEFYGRSADRCRAPCSQAGNGQAGASVASIAAGLLTLHDASSNRTFLIDTGAEVSVVPATEQERQKAPLEKELVAANGSRIMCYGEKKVRFHVGARTYEWNFLVADVKRSLIGADFLTHSSLLVDLRNKQMVHPDDLNGTPLQQMKHRSQITRLAFAATAKPSPLAKLFAEFPTITVPNFKIERPKHAVQHTIETRGQPIRAKARPLPQQKLAAAKANFAEMAASGIVRRSNGPWSSPLHVVTKKDGSFRMCGDYRRLNTVTTPDRYSIPLIADLTSRLQGKKIFGKVDLVKSYHQIPVAEQDIAKTAITTPFGTYEFLRMPFGLKNAGQTFQRMMDEILSDLDYLFVYMDDVLVASRSMEEHLEHFRELFRRLTAHDLVVSPAKCQFGKTQIEFLGHSVTKDGIQPLPEKVAAINAYTVPSSMDELRRFLGMVNFYNRFIPNAAKIMKPLYEATTAETCRKQKNGKERACIELKTSKKPIEWNDGNAESVS